jgi:hypothetical protein
MSTARRIFCLVVGLPLVVAGAYFVLVLFGAERFKIWMVLVPFMLLFGGGALLKSGITGR